MTQATTYSISSDNLTKISEYENRHFGHTTRLDTLVSLMEASGHDMSTAIFSGYMVNEGDTKLVARFIDEEQNELHGEWDVKQHEELEGHFLIAMTLAPAMQALSDQPFCLLYTLSNLLGHRIVVGDVATYPKYVPTIQPKFMDNPEYGTEDAQTVAMRFTRIGDNRTSDSVQATPVIARYAVEPTDEETSNNFGEIYPVLMHGNYIEFNAMVQFDHELIIPVSNETPIARFKEVGARLEDAVTAVPETNSYWLYTMTNRKVGGE